MNDRSRRSGALGIRANIDGVKRKTGRVLWIDVISDDLDVEYSLAVIGARPAKLRNVNATALWHLADDVVLDVDLGVLLALHENTQTIANRGAGACHCCVADDVPGNKRLVGSAAAVGAICKIHSMAVAASDGQVVDKSIVGAASTTGAAAAFKTCRHVVVGKTRAGDGHRSVRRSADAVPHYRVVV